MFKLIRSSAAISGSRSFSTASLKKLRELTGAPLVDCKNALAASENDIEKAKAWIAERNKSVVAKISGRSAKQGLIGIALSETNGSLVEVNCETDFVARGADFQDLVRARAQAVLNASDVSEDETTKVAGRVRENIVLGGSLRLVGKPGSILGSYLHNTVGPNVGSSAAIVSLSNMGSLDPSAARAIARAVAVQVVGAKPPHITREQVPADIRKSEEDKILAESADSFKGKPEKAKEAMLRGKMQKFYGDMCLLDQPFILGEFEGRLVKEVLPKGALIDGFIRFSVGGDNLSSKS